jgi:hypothetical protein
MPSLAARKGGVGMTAQQDFRSHPDWHIDETELIKLHEAERATNWAKGDHYCYMVKKYGRGVIGTLAETARKSGEHIRQCIRVAVAFPRECRKELVVLDWSDCREIYQAAKRSKGEIAPVELARKVIDGDMSVGEVRLLYKDPNAKPPVYRFAATCEKCGARVIIYIGDIGRAKSRGLTEEGILYVHCGICGHYLGKVE